MSGFHGALVSYVRRLIHSMSLTVGTSGGNKGYVNGAFGSVDNAGGIVELYWIDSTDTLIFAVGTAGVPNFDSTFEVLTIGSTSFLRNAASYSSAVNSTWTWTGISSDPFASSPVAVTLHGG